MKVAIFHPFLDTIGGAEIVTLTLARHLDAFLYTTNIDQEKIEKMGFADVLPRIKSIGRVPIQAPWKQQMALIRFHFLDVSSEYDRFIVAGDWAVSAVYKNKPCLWYVHSPFNELWAYKDFVKKNMLSCWQRPFYEVWVFFNRLITRFYAKRYKWLVCNSCNSQKRLLDYYGLSGTVINPPVDTKFYTSNDEGDYWLSVNRLTPAKRVEMQFEAFNKLKGERLIVVGSYEKGAEHFEQYLDSLRAVSKEGDITLKHWVSSDELKMLYSRAKGFITTSKDEDFGMTAVEAMAAGKPVIAPNEGGYKETVVSGKTGVLIDMIDSQKLALAIENMSLKLKQDPLFFKTASLERAKDFDTRLFIEKIQKQYTL